MKLITFFKALFGPFLHPTGEIPVRHTHGVELPLSHTVHAYQFFQQKAEEFEKGSWPHRLAIMKREEARANMILDKSGLDKNVILDHNDYTRLNEG